MRSRILETLDALPTSCETLLVAMSYCGDSWNHIPLSKRVGIPKVDDCITLLLHTDDTPHGNLKEAGHMYFRDIIDTGVYDCYSEEYVTEMQKTADLIRCSLGYVEGNNHILEKLVSGQWDAQFVVLESGREMTEQDFGLNTQNIKTMQY